MTDNLDYLKTLTLIILGLVWLTSLVILVTRLRKRLSGAALTTPEKEVRTMIQPRSNGYLNGVQVVKNDNEVIINIDPDNLSRKIQLTMETTSNHLVMQILPGGIIHDPTPEPDVQESDVLSSQDEIDSVIKSNSGI